MSLNLPQRLELSNFFSNPPPAVYSITDGSLLANIDLPAYLSSGLTEEHVPSSFCLLQVSADLSTAVAVTQSHTAVAIDVNHYFRYSSRKMFNVYF